MSSSELRQKWWSRPLGHVLWFLITLVCFTLRKRVTGHVQALLTRQSVVTLWHNRIFIPCYLYRYVLRGSIPMSMLTSASKDGAMLAAVAQDYGMRAVRGSSRRRGAVGFMDMVREMEVGCHMCITPDGPKGPLYHCHPGAIKLASLSGAPLLPVRIRYSRCRRVKSWDRFIVPLPFSRVEMEVGEPLYVPRELEEGELADWCRRLELLLGNDDAVDPYIQPRKQS